jgi:hypothetical protein
MRLKIIFTNDACSRKFFILYQLLPSWRDWLLCPSAILAPSRSPRATIKPTILARYALPKGAQVTAIDGGTSQYCPQVAVNHKKSPRLLCHSSFEIISHHKYCKQFPVCRCVICKCMPELHNLYILIIFPFFST